MKRYYAVSRTQHFTDHYLFEVSIEGKSEEEIREHVRTLAQQEMFEPYYTEPRADDGDARIHQVSQDDVQKIEQEFGGNVCFPISE